MANLILKDVDGNQVIVSDLEIVNALMARNLVLFGMTLDVIQELRNQYLLRGGPLPLTVVGVKEVLKV